MLSCHLRSFFAGFLLLIASTADLAAQQTMVTVDRVITEPLAQTVPLLGSLVPRISGEVSSLAKGIVESFEVEVGDRLERGQIIAKLDSERAQLEVDLAHSGLRQAQAARANAAARTKLLEQELKRLEKLRASAAFNQSQYNDKQLELEAARAQMGEAEATIGQRQAVLRKAEVQIRDASVRAPYAGIVLERHSEVGAYIDTGDTIISLMDDSRLEIEVEVPVQRLDGLAIGANLRFEIDDIEAKATVRAIIPRENPLTRTRPVRLTPALPESALRQFAANQSVTIHLPLKGARSILSVHKDAIVRRQGQAMVFRMIDGRAKPTPVSLGEASGVRFEVLDGLQEDDLVVIRGNERLAPDQEIAVESGG